MLSLLILVTLAMLRTDGHWAFVIDDGAIHLSIADTLVHHGTWGVTAGVFESASSSPVWTVILAAGGWPFSAGREFLPLALNAVAGVWVLLVLAHSQSAIWPSHRRPLDAVAAIVLAVVILFIPGLAATGMEHLLHAALIVTVLHLLATNAPNDLTLRRRTVVLSLLAVASLVRFESMFFVAGLVTGQLLTTIPRLSPWPRVERLRPVARLAASCSAAAALPIVGFALLNKAMGQDWLPNTVIAKSALGGSARDALIPSLQDTTEALGRDPLILALALLMVGYLVSAWFGGPRRAVVPAAAYLVATLLHSAYGDYGWYERYQSYLIVLGAYASLTILSEVAEPRRRRALLIVALAAVPLIAPAKWSALYEVPLSSDNTYRQRYQLGRFFETYYDGRPVATGELGYATLFHDGPVVDLLGLASHDVVEALDDGRTDAAYWRDLVAARDVEVVAMYPSTLRYLENPTEWTLVGEWTLGERRTSALDARFQFWAPRPELVEPVREHLLSFAPRLPEGVETICHMCG